MAAGIGPLLGAGNAAGALSAMIVGGVLYALLATFNIQYRLSSDCARVTVKFIGFSDRKPIRLFRFASHRIVY